MKANTAKAMERYEGAVIPGKVETRDVCFIESDDIPRFLQAHTNMVIFTGYSSK
jgi:hypothetical protein